MKIGLTGGIGCGKSTVGNFLQQAGWLRIDSDQLVRELLDTDPEVQQALLAHFGSEALLPSTVTCSTAPSASASATPLPLPAVVTATQQPTTAAHPSAPLQSPPATGQVANRPFLAKHIFTNPHERAWLEALLHPRVRLRWETLAAAAGTSPVLVEIPLLFEKSLEKHFDLTVCVEADHHVQLARLQSRGMSLADAEARIASQMPLAEKIIRADKILSNNGTEDFLHTQALRLSNELLAERHPR